MRERQLLAQHGLEPAPLMQALDEIVREDRANEKVTARLGEVRTTKPALARKREKLREQLRRNSQPRDKFLPKAAVGGTATKTEEDRKAEIREEIERLAGEEERLLAARKQHIGNRVEAATRATRLTLPLAVEAVRAQADSYRSLSEAEGRSVEDVYAREVIPAERRAKDLRTVLKGLLSRASAGPLQRQRVTRELEGVVEPDEDLYFGWLLAAFLAWTRRGKSPVFGRWEARGVEQAPGLVGEQEAIPARRAVLAAIERGGLPWKMDV